MRSEIGSSHESCLLHELELDHVLVHEQHHVFERLTLLELVSEHLLQHLVGLSVDQFNVSHQAFLRLRVSVRVRLAHPRTLTAHLLDFTNCIDWPCYA